LLHFDDPLPDPEQFALPSAYLGMGEEWGLAARFKCRIRDPWYRVPVVPSSELLLSKRSHRFPRIVVNDANVVTTDTIYLGRPLTTEYSALDIAAVFHNSLSMLSAELEGRSFGGGVLELVPSEVGRLLLPKVPNFGENLSGLDHVARVHGSDSDDLIDATDQLIARGRKGLTRPLLDRLREARGTLLQRRLDRNAL
jgi:adenine-specific DNA-methyltransferase